MKRFHELTKEQQEAAVKFAKEKTEDLLGCGVIEEQDKMTQTQFKEVTEAMAEDAWYSERTDMVIADIADGE